MVFWVPPEAPGIVLPQALPPDRLHAPRCSAADVPGRLCAGLLLGLPRFRPYTTFPEGPSTQYLRWLQKPYPEWYLGPESSNIVYTETL